MHSNNGWILTEVCHGLRVFSRPFTSLVRTSDGTSDSPLPAVAASLVLAVPVKVTLCEVCECMYIHVESERTVAEVILSVILYI